VWLSQVLTYVAASPAADLQALDAASRALLIVCFSLFVLMCIVSAAVVAAAAAAAASPLQALDAASRALTGAAAVEMAPALADLVRRGKCNNSMLFPLFLWPVIHVVQVPPFCRRWQALV
jgi:hypothetical protein